MDIEAFVDGLIKNNNLNKLMDEEVKLYKQIRMLESEMHTLLYENYNKLINAAQTIRQMSNNFDQMELELNLLSDNMKEITQQSNRVSTNLSDKRVNLSKLSSTSKILKRLQFLFEFPSHMNSLIEVEKFQEAVNYYIYAHTLLDQCRQYPSLKSINDECNSMGDKLKSKLYEQLKMNKDLLPQQSIDIMVMLCKLNETTPQTFLGIIVDQYLSRMKTQYNAFLQNFQQTTFPYSRSLTLHKATIDKSLEESDSVISPVSIDVAMLDLSNTASSIQTSPTPESITELITVIINQCSKDIEELNLDQGCDIFLSKNQIRERVVIGFFQFCLHQFRETSKHRDQNQNDQSDLTSLVTFNQLTMSRFCYDMERLLISPLVTNIDLAQTLADYSRDTAHELLNSYVNEQGQTLSHVVRKSIEQRDWLSSHEPKTSRPIMRGLLENLIAIDNQVGQYYETGNRIERSIDFIYNHQNTKANTRKNATLADTLITNIKRLFSERIEIFSAVEFSRRAIMTGVIRIVLKTLIEGVRLSTFSKYGFQQIQIDSYYLQTNLSRFVSDENVVAALLDEVLISADNRCVEPILMDWKVVKQIVADNNA